MGADENVHLFAEALVCSSRHPTIREEEDIYASLLGNWTVTTRDVLNDGNIIQGQGEWLFARVLEGRAVQDIWIAPPRAERSRPTSHPRNRYGTTIRTFDPASRRWQVCWFNPVSGAFDLLHAELRDGKLIQVGSGSTGSCISWTFESITSTEFHWVGRTKAEDGAWKIGAEFFGRRSA